MMRTFLLWLSEQQGVFNFLRRNSLARKFASRFVAGETRETATSAALELKHLGIGTTLDLLGESVNRPADAVAARDEYLRMLDGLAASGADINVSVKLTQMGFDIDEAVCLDNMRRILAKARDLGGFVRLDMESSAYTQRTLDFFERHLLAEFGKHTGVVIQSCLRRSAADVQRLIEIGARVRLCKGAYLESPDVAFPDKKDVDRQFIALMEALLRHGNYPGIATHDHRMIEHARAFVTREGIPAERFEFQMLYGVRRDLQERLRKDGFNMRVYIPFGTQWYPYLMRRLAERPANIVFIFGNVVRETLALKP
jgi:proline dehydrogenase